MLVSMRNLTVALAVVLLISVVARGSTIMAEGSLSFAVTPTGGYGGDISNLVEIYLGEFIHTGPLLGAVGFASFPADTSYKFQFGLIPANQYTGTAEDMNKMLGIQVVYAGGTAGKVYPVVKGVTDPDGSVTITDILGGVDASVTITDILGGVDSLVVFTSEGDYDADGYLTASVGYPDGPLSTSLPYDPEEWAGGAYLVAQVFDPNLTGHTLTGSGFFSGVPEPSTLILLVAGSIVLLYRLRNSVTRCS